MLSIHFSGNVGDEDHHYEHRTGGTCTNTTLTVQSDDQQDHQLNAGKGKSSLFEH